MPLSNHVNRSRLIFRSHTLGKGLVAAGLFLGLLASVGLVQPARAERTGVQTGMPALQEDGQGQQIFNEKCAGCHSIGGGRLVGPDLKDVTLLRDPQWIKRFISDPAKMIASDATAKQLYQEYNNTTMPSLGLSDAEIDAVLAYLSNPGAVAAAPAIAPGMGDAANGQHLFTGEMALSNGGTPCIACHSVSGTGALGGGGLGPDLTQVVQRLGEPGLSASLNTIAFPTMVGPFQNRPLTPAEQADLVAFLKQANQWQPSQAAVSAGALSTDMLLVFVIGLAGALILFGLLLVLWPRQNNHRSAHLPVRKL